MKVLIIDEDEFILDMYERVMQSQKIEVIKAHDKSAALSILQTIKELPHVIVMEVMMTDSDGFEFLQQLKTDKHYSEIPIIVLSNLYAREDRKKGLDSGAAAYLVKSEHDPKEIVAEIKNVTN